MLLDRLLVALQNAMDEEQASDIRSRMIQFEKSSSILRDAEDKVINDKNKINKKIK